MSLRAKVIGLSLAITAMALAVSAATSIVQMHYQVDAGRRGAADSVALGMARASELAMARGDAKELSRLASDFLDDPELLFIAVYSGNSNSPIAAVRSWDAWSDYLNGQLDPDRCIVAEHAVESLARGGAASANVSTPVSVGRVIVGLSTEATQQSQWRQSSLILSATLLAAFIGGALLYLALGTWLRRLQNLADASQSIARGDFSHSISDRHDDEIGRLAHSFEGMRLALLGRDVKLRIFTETLQDQVQQRTRDLEHALIAAEEASRAKSLFLANMSHELRTPLNGVIGMVDLLQLTAANPQQRRYCDLAKVSARSLLELINDVLDFSKIEAGKLELDAVDFDFYETIEATAQMFGEHAQKKKLELVCGIDPHVPRHVNGDPVRLRQVLMNLLSNAVKFTERGEVIVQVTLHDQSESSATVKIEVRDTGCGIPKDRLDRLFKSFSQVDTSTTRKFGGTGLGLAISQRIVEMMGGQAGVSSKEGKGSTFWFTAKLKKCDPHAGDTATVDLHDMRVLIVDDNNANRESLHAQLAGWLLRPDEACTCQQALEMLQAAATASDPYRVAFLDMQMPGSDARQFARQIKADPRLRGVILIGLSPISGDPAKDSELSKFGFAACLNKPILPSNLYDTLVRTIAAEARGERNAPEEQASPFESLPLAGLKVLLVEDNEINEMVAVEILTRSGCQVSVARNGADAVEAAAHGGIDCILMDCQMPTMDGLEATRLIRQRESQSNPSAHVPIIALTANAIKGDRELCLAAGMDGYVTKPIEAAEVITTIQSLVRHGRAESAGATAPNPDSAEGGDDLSPVDFGALRRRCLGNRKLAGKVLETFASSIGGYIQDLSRNLQDGDAKSAAATAHRIKGAAGNVSATRVLHAAARLEELGRTDALAQAEPILAELKAEVDRVRQFIDNNLSELIGR